MQASVAVTEAFECPRLERLIEFDLGKLSEPESLSLADHVSSCDRCEKALLELHGKLNDDSVVAFLKKCLGSSDWDELAYLEFKQLASTIGSGDAPAADCPSQSMESMPALDKYQLLQEIGNGGQGVVYRAKHLALGWTLAVKMISTRRCTTPQSVVRFVREGKVLARLVHPNIVRIVDFDFQGAVPYFAMELMEGGNLAKKIEKESLTPREAAQLVSSIARAVEFMHRKNVFHRDLKPSNILLDLQGIPKISDFGLAKLVDTDTDASPSPDLTESGTIMGTVGYLAPEFVYGTPRNVGPTIDIYALGAILYELLSGRPPFSATNRDQLREVIRAKRAVAPSKIREGIPAWLDEVCLKCLEKRSSLRYPTAEALADDLDAWLKDQTPDPTIRRAARLWRNARRPGAIVAACSVPLVFLAMAFGPSDPDRELRRIQAELSKGRTVTLIGETGIPRWYRWNTGEANAKLTRGSDRTTTIQSFDTSIIELAPDPQSDHYRITAQIRHDQCDVSGEVGLFFAHTKYRIQPNEAHFFLQVGFNSVWGDADFQALFPIDLRRDKSPMLNAVLLRPHLISPGLQGPNFDINLSSVTGPRFESKGEFNGIWHDLEITVAPEEVAIQWDGERFREKVDMLKEFVKFDLREGSPSRTVTYPANLNPQVDLRGGLGLYIRGGVASFRSVKIEPLGIQ